MFYTTCPICGAALDPGERCDCTEEPRPQADNPKSFEIRRKEKC